MTDFILIEGTYINKNNICFIEYEDLISKKKPSKYLLIIGFTGSVIKNIIYSSSEERNKVLNILTRKTIQSVIVETPVEPINPGRPITPSYNSNDQILGITSSPYNPLSNYVTYNQNDTPPPYLNYSASCPSFAKIPNT